MGFSFRRYVLSVLSRREADVRQLDWKRLRFSYAQQGEDIIAETLLPEPLGFYVDVGAFHPVQLSNTYLFYRKGWRGIAIDANPKAVQAFQGRRPRDIVLQCAVGEKEGTITFDLMHADEIAHVRGAGVEGAVDKPPVKSLSVPCRRLDSILKEHLPAGQQIDFLTVDCEGHDLSVLHSNDWEKYRPRVIAVEDWEPEAQSQICRFVLERGYKLVITAKVTRFFERQ